MINPNLYFLNQFLLEKDIQYLIEVGESKLCPAEELGLVYSRAVSQTNSADFELFLQVNPRVLKILSPDEKVRIYEILRLFSLGSDLASWKYIFEDYNQLLKLRGFRHERYLYLNSLTDNYFCYEMDCKLTKGYSSRRDFYRRVNSKYINNSKTLEEVLLEFFRIRVVRKNKKHPRRLIRHKGYRDHGSLGTGDRTLTDDIKNDIWLLEKERIRKKQKSDFLEFLAGFNGSE